MKKLLLSVFSALLLSTNANSQIIWQEDFETTTGTAIPATMSQTTLATDGGFKSGTGASLSSTSFDIPEHTRILATNDDGCNCNKSADILNTPSFSLTGFSSNVYLQFDALYYKGTYNNVPETAEVLYSTNGGTTWTSLYTFNTGSASWQTIAVPLTPVLGQANVQLAFKYNDGGDWLFGLALDNIKVLVPPSKDVAVTNAYPTGRYIPTNPQFQARFTTFGLDPVSSVTLMYQMGASAPVSQTFNFATPLNFTNSQLVTFNPAALTPGAQNNFKVWVTNINGTGPDAVNYNDTATYTGQVNVAFQTTNRNVLVEEFTSSTCAPCASLNVTFDPLLEANTPNTGGQFNVVKYQMNWPAPGNDPSYNPDGATRRAFYGVNGIPFVVLNGTSSMPSKTQGAIDSAKAIPAFANIVASVTRSGTTYTGTATVTPYVTIASGSNLVLYQSFNQKFYNYPGATTSQKEYHHAMRKMMPNGNGKAFSSVTNGTPINESANYTFNTVATPTQGSYDMWSTTEGKVEYVVFLQDTVSGEILQSASGNISVGIVELEDNQSIGTYPNPANEYVVIATKLKEEMNISLSIIDMNGRVVYRKENSTLKAGQQELTVDTKSFATGAYQIVIQTPKGNLYDKMIIRH
ncbi:MAG: T9SS type A sorting domain-containing protein [Chitinophagaceae bacterium]